MASTGTLDQARKLLVTLEARQAQGSLASQALDCAPIVDALGYYDLADHLRRMGGEYPPRRSLDVRELPEWVDVEEALEDVQKAHALHERTNAAWRCRDALVALSIAVEKGP